MGESKDILKHPKLQDLCRALQEQQQDFEESTYEPFNAIEDDHEYDELYSKAARYMAIYDVEDIIPATDLQASCVAFSTFTSRHSGINWLLCDFVGPHLADTVRNLCQVWTARRKLRHQVGPEACTDRRVFRCDIQNRIHGTPRSSVPGRESIIPTADAFSSPPARHQRCNQ